VKAGWRGENRNGSVLPQKKIAINRAYRQAPTGRLAGVLLVDREKLSTNTKRIEEEPVREKEPACSHSWFFPVPDM
jgi:hypothetical protein